MAQKKSTTQISTDALYELFRTSVQLPHADLRRLARLTRIRKMTQSELIRRAVTLMLDVEENSNAK